ncbi:MAG: hypothetical protein FJY91_02705 [Candidatus Harrisonbacteria bacterium]|nr:hypothetical protein [Candidatus Harrisonbacteria bacterium]
MEEGETMHFDPANDRIFYVNLKAFDAMIQGRTRTVGAILRPTRGCVPRFFPPGSYSVTRRSHGVQTLLVTDEKKDLVKLANAR